MGAIPVHHTGVDTQSAWDANAEVSKLSTPISGSVAEGMFAYYDSRGADDNKDGWPDNKGSYKFPHHNVVSGKPGDANLKGVNNAMARLSQAKVPQSNIADIKAHLQAHQEDAKVIQGRNNNMQEKGSNTLSNLFRAVADVINDHLKPRAVSIEDIWQYVQNELSIENPAPAPDGMDSGDGSYSSQPTAYVLDVYTDGSAIFAIVTKSDGKLYKVPVTVAADNSIETGTYEEVSLEFAPATGRQLSVKRQADGKVRWFAMPACTSVLNRSGEIDSRALFDSFIEHTERTNDYPELDFFHCGEQILLGRADWVGRDGVAYCASGLFYDTPIARAAIAELEKDPEYWGLSIAYTPTKDPEMIRSSDGIQIPVYNTGINRFISLLPENTAASILTSISTKQEINRMNEKVKAALQKLTGEDRDLFEAIVLKVDSINRESVDMVQRGGDAITTTETHVVETSTPAVPVAQAPAPAVAPEFRAITPDDLTAILNAPEFEAKVNEIVKKAMGMADGTQAPAQPAQANEVQQSVLSPEAVAAQVDAQTELRTMLADLSAKVDGIAKNRDEQVQEVLNDMPARMTRQAPVRPRATILPAQLNRKVVDMAAIASETLSRLPVSAKQ